MVRRRRIAVWGIFIAACGNGGGGTGAASPPAAGAAPAPPIAVKPFSRGGWTFYGAGQGLSEDVQDVSADEGGNTYVAGGDALYVKRPADQAFLRFDASTSGLTRNCNDYSEFFSETPAKPFYTCRIISVAGAAPGNAIIGFDSFPIESQIGAQWTYTAGGADVVAFDAEKATLARKRHVWIASPPHVICGNPYSRGGPCDPSNYWWENGRRVTTRVRRIVVNHDRSSPLYGDAWFGCQHATFAALLENAQARGMADLTAGWGPQWTDAKDVWEHEHPNLDAPDGTFVNGEGWALSIDPRDGKPWGSNEYRTTSIGGYGASLADLLWWMEAKLDLWKDPVDVYFGPTADAVRSMSHCPDGTLWIGSLAHGLARVDPDGGVSYPSLPPGDTGVSAIACDPVDASVWIGLASGGVLRMRGGSFEQLDTTELPAFTANPVQSIQIDRWSPTRSVYFAFRPLTDGEGRILAGGGVGAYAGP